MAKKPQPGLRVRVLADTSAGDRVARYHPLTGEKMLVRPESLQAEGFDYEQMTPEPWPAAGIEFVDGPPKRITQLPTRWVRERKREGVITLEGASIAHRPGGPASDEWAVSHTFEHAEAIVFHTPDGDVRYRVTHQPDKYADERQPGERGLEPPPEISPAADAAPVTPDLYEAGCTRVDHFYSLELEG